MDNHIHSTYTTKDIELMLAKSNYNDPTGIQEGGSHYKAFQIQPIEFAMMNDLDICQANVIKYVCRFRMKGGLDDLKKARHYLELLAHYEYGETL